MNNTKTFAGEIEFDGRISPEQDFGKFQNLPLVNEIHELAAEFSNCIELMPYQKVGENVKLLISVYLESKQNSGTIIAVLIRDTYPITTIDLAKMVRHAYKIFTSLPQLTQQFEKGSILSAEDALSQLHQRISAR